MQLLLLHHQSSVFLRIPQAAKFELRIKWEKKKSSNHYKIRALRLMLTASAP